jgi:UDP-N-acetylmuramyl tripeptide synthase
MKHTQTISDSRRLTGPNLFWNKPGAILDVEIDDTDKDKVISLWIKHCRYLLDTLAWDTEQITHRPYAGGASLVISAPIDCLYAATEITEQAWQMTVDEINGVNTNVNKILKHLHTEIAAEQNPALIALQQAAKQHKIKFLSDDDEVSLGYGQSCQIYAVNKLPEIDAIDWGAIKDVPVAMVTGTNGKSTTVRLASSVVKAAGLNCGITSTDYIRVGEKILDTGDYSGPGGARTLLRHPETQTALLEVARGGMLRRGLGVNEATCVVVTNVAEDHLGEYGINTLSDMVAAKFTVRQAITQDQDLILNADDAGSTKFAQSLDNTIVWFSWYANNPVILTHLSAGGRACFVENGNIVYQQGSNKSVIVAVNDIPITFGGAARHNIHNALAVTALSRALGFDNATIAQGLKDFTSSAENNPGRGNLFQFNGINAIVDFAHNAHGLSQMAQTIKNMPATRRLILMGQAGDRSDELIYGLVKSALQAEPEQLIICELPTHLRGRKPGETPALIHKYARQLGMRENQLSDAEDAIEGTKMALSWARPGDVLLILALTNRNEVIQLLTQQA